MKALDQPDATGRLQRAMAAFRRAQVNSRTARRGLKDLPPNKVGRFWATEGNRTERRLHEAAIEAIAAFNVFSAAGLVPEPSNCDLINEARRIVAEGEL